MPTVRVTEHPELDPVFGPLDEEQAARITDILDQTDARMAEVHEHLVAQGATWRAEGVVVSTEVSGQSSIDLLIEEAAGKLTFEAQLRPRNYFPTEEAMWQPGRPPLRMATDGWDVDAAVSVRFKTRVANRPYTIQERVREIDEKRYDSPLAAVEAFAAACEQIAKLARSREATVAAWKPETAT